MIKARRGRRCALCRLAGACALLLLRPAGRVLAEPPTQALHIAYDGNDSHDLAPAGRAILEQAYRRLGVTVRFEALPLRRSLRQAALGEIDGEALRVAEVVQLHPSLLQVPVPIHWVQVRMLTLRSKPLSPQHWDDLRPLRVAYQRGILLLEKALTDQPRKVEASSPRDLMHQLELGMADVALLTLGAGQGVAESMPTELVLLPQALAVVPLYHLLHQRHAALLPRLTAVLQQMESSGESARLRQR